MAKNCICFLRVSTVQQDLTAQRESVVSAAVADGYKKSEIAVVEGKESAIKLKEEQRDTLNEMKQIIAENPSVEAVYVFALDRLARSVSMILSIKDYLTERGINLVFLNPKKLSTMQRNKQGKMEEDRITSMMLLFLAYGAEMEMKLKLERFSAKKQLMQKQKKLTSGKPVFGYYKKKDGTIGVDDEKAGYVKEIYKEILVNNKSIKQVEREFIARGILPPKKVVTGSTVRYICANKCYYGSTTTFGSIMEYPPIITQSEFDEMRKKLEENRKGAKKNTKQTHLCKGIIRNADSGLVMMYNCGGRSYFDYSNSQNVNAPTMDFIVWYVAKILITMQKAIDTKERNEDYSKYIEVNNQKIAQIKKMMAGIEKRQKKAFNMYLDGKVPDKIYKEEIKAIEEEHKQWSNEIVRLESENRRLLYEDYQIGTKNQWESTNLDEIEDARTRREIIQSVIKELSVRKVGNHHYQLKVHALDVRVGNLYEEIQQHFDYQTSGNKITLLEYNNRGRVDKSGDKITLQESDNRVKVRVDISNYIKSGKTPSVTINYIDDKEEVEKMASKPQE